MGMFDNIDGQAMRCPGCGAPLDFQTKDLDCNLDRYTVREAMELLEPGDRGRKSLSMLGGCEGCRWWVRVEVKSGNNPVDIDQGGAVVSDYEPVITDNGTVWTPILLGGEWLYRSYDYCVVYTRDQLAQRFGIEGEQG